MSKKETTDEYIGRIEKEEYERKQREEYDWEVNYHLNELSKLEIDYHENSALRDAVVFLLERVRITK